jgi:hypothetical protein
MVTKDGNGNYVVAESEPPMSLELAYADAAFVQRRYISAVHDQGNATPQLSAALIGLSALTLYKGITDPSATALAAAGVIGSTAWVYGNTMLSKPRLDVYRAGAEALSCAMVAVEPLRKGQKTLGQPTDGADQSTLYGRRAAVTQAGAALESLLRQHASLAAGVTTTEEVPSKDCKDVKVPAACPAPPAGTSASERTLFDARCRQLPPRTVRQCTSRLKAETVTTPAPPAVVALFNEAREQTKAAAQQVRKAGRVIDTLTEAGPLLWKKSVQIQLAVSEEVDKTVPDLSSVLAAAGGMGDIAFALTGAPAFKPGTAQGAPKPGSFTAQQNKDLEAIQRATDALRDARVALEDMAANSLGSGHAQARKALNDCALKVSGIKLDVTPSEDSVAVAQGGTAVFFVSGGSGVPSAMDITSTPPAPLPVKVEGGQIRFDFAAPKTAAVGDTFMLRFSDGARAATKLVEVVVTAPPSASSGGSQSPKTDDTPPADVGSGTPGKFKDMTKDEKALLGLADSASDAEIQAAIDTCQRTAEPAIQATRNFDAKTKQALQAQPPACKVKV